MNIVYKSHEEQPDRQNANYNNKKSNYLCKTMNKHKGFLFDAQP